MPGPHPSQFTVAASAEGQRLDVWLTAQAQPFSRTQLYARIQRGEVRINDCLVIQPFHLLGSGDQVVFSPGEPVAAADLPESIPLTVPYEDTHLLVVDKPAGLVVHPATAWARGTLVNALLHHCGPASFSIAGTRRPGIVHRLDRDTSGLLVVAKEDEAHRGLARQFESHSATRLYLALAEGQLDEQGCLDTDYGRDPRDGKRYTSRADLLGGRSTHRAITRWHAKQRFSCKDGLESVDTNSGATLIEVRLETGRTHQIRVHMRDHDHPLLGDPIYGRPARTPLVRGVAARLGRQALHAAVLRFTHPISGLPLEFSSPLPADMLRALASLAPLAQPSSAL